MPGQASVSVKNLLREILQEDRNLLTDRDNLIARLGTQTTGAMMGEFTSLKTALQKNIGERFLAADDASEEEKATVCSEVKAQLIQEGMQERRAGDVVEALSYALGWDEDTSTAEAATYAALDYNGVPEEMQAPGAAGMAEPWTCVCGSVNDGNFCVDCGRLRPSVGQQPSAAPQYAATPQQSQPLQYAPAQPPYAPPYPPPSGIPMGNSPRSGGIDIKMIAAAIAGVLLVAGIAFFFIKGKESSDSTQSAPVAATQIQSGRAPVTADSSIGGLKIGDSEAKLRQCFGREFNKRYRRENAYYAYDYDLDGSMHACFTDSPDNIDFIYYIRVQHNSTAQTDRGIHLGSTIPEMLKVYDDNYVKEEEKGKGPGKVTYTYSFPSPVGKEPGKLKFTFSSVTQNLVAMELSIPRSNLPMPKVNPSDQDVARYQAIDVLKSYHQAITDRKFRLAYEFFTPDQQKEHGTLENYTKGYENTLTSEIVEAWAEPYDQMSWKVHYKLKARDREGTRVKVQFFEGTARIFVRSGKIADMASRKTGEGYE